MSQESYSGGSYAAGKLVPIHITVKAGTYYRGQLLGHETGSAEYEAHDASASNGSELSRLIFFEGEEGVAVTLPTTRTVLVLGSGSEYLGSGLRAADGSALAVTPDLKQQLLEQGNIIIR